MELQDHVVEADGVVVAHDPVVLKTESGVEDRSRELRPVGRAGDLWSNGKGAVVAAEKSREIGVRFFHRRGASKTELGDEAILESPPEPFDATLRLGRVRGDEPDVHFGHGSPELGGRTPSSELFLEGLAVGRPEDAVAVAVERMRDAHFVADLAEQAEVAAGVLGLSKRAPTTLLVASSMTPRRVSLGPRSSSHWRRFAGACPPGDSV